MRAKEPVMVDNVVWWRVDGADRASGAARCLIVDAADANEAETKAQARGMLVSGVTRDVTIGCPTPPAAGWWVAGLLAAVGLLMLVAAASGCDRPRNVGDHVEAAILAACGWMSILTAVLVVAITAIGGAGGARGGGKNNPGNPHGHKGRNPID
jgi:hypothetical protein